MLQFFSALAVYSQTQFDDYEFPAIWVWLPVADVAAQVICVHALVVYIDFRLTESCPELWNVIIHTNYTSIYTLSQTLELSPATDLSPLYFHSPISPSFVICSRTHFSMCLSALTGIICAFKASECFEGLHSVPSIFFYAFFLLHLWLVSAHLFLFTLSVFFLEILYTRGQGLYWFKHSSYSLHLILCYFLEQTGITSIVAYTFRQSYSSNSVLPKPLNSFRLIWLIFR